VATVAPRLLPATERLLVAAASFFAFTVLLHNADPVRRGADAVSTDVFWIGSAAIVLEVGVVFLAVQRHRLAGLAAAVVGLSLAAGYVVVHFLPARGWLSDSFPSGVDVSPLSWGAASLEVAGALVLGAAGLAALRRQPVPAAAVGLRGVRDTLAHPVVAVMVLGNIVVLVASIAQRAGG
jgi:hypothetical protein